MDEEFGRLDRAFPHIGETQIGPRSFFEARVNNLELIMARSRIGKVAAAATTAILVDHFRVDAVLLTGVAGAIKAPCGLATL